MEHISKKIETATANYGVHAAKFRSATNSSEMNLALDNLSTIDPKDTELVNKAYSLVTDKAEHKNIRQKALKALTDYVHNSESSVKDLISIMSDQNEPAEMRKSAMHSLSSISFNSPALNAQMAQYKQALRALVDDKDPDLVQSAVSKLAAYHDGMIQQRLADGLRDHTKALVPDEQAVQLLGLDKHNIDYKLIADVLARSKNPVIMIESINVLAGDPGSKGAIQKIFDDKTENLQVRLAALSALNAMDPEHCLSHLKKIVSDQAEDKEVKTAALTALSLQDDLGPVYKDNAFTTVVENLKSTDHEGLKKMSEQFSANKDKQ